MENNIEPAPDCALCPRLKAFRDDNIAKFGSTDWHNAPVESFGAIDARLWIVGLAPGLKGANKTSRPFTGDNAGDLLFPALVRAGFATGTYDARIDDGLDLVDCRITNAVRCVPPENKVTAAELTECRPFLQAEMHAMQNLHAILCLGGVAHNAVLTMLKLKKKDHKFGHNQVFDLGEGISLHDSYHCSRYNVNTGVLTEAMFDDVLQTIRHQIDPV